MGNREEPELPVVVSAGNTRSQVVSPELLALLRCPVTGSELLQQGDELVTVHTRPQGEQLRYPIVDAIPDLVQPDANSTVS